jgi:hypothetical protein
MVNDGSMEKITLILTLIIILVFVLIIYFIHANIRSSVQNTGSVQKTNNTTSSAGHTNNTIITNNEIAPPPGVDCPTAPVNPSKSKVLSFVNMSKSKTFAACANAVLSIYKSDGILEKYNINYSS